VVEDRDLIGIAHGRESVRDGDGRAAASEVLEGLLDCAREDDRAALNAGPLLVQRPGT